MDHIHTAGVYNPQQHSCNLEIREGNTLNTFSTSEISFCYHVEDRQIRKIRVTMGIGVYVYLGLVQTNLPSLSTLTPEKCIFIQLPITHNNKLTVNVFWRLFLAPRSHHHQATTHEQTDKDTVLVW
jgi:hypothetical protein